MTRLVVGSVSVQGGGLPAERGELACASDRDDTGGLAALPGQSVPALVQATLGAPGDLDHPRVLAVLAAREGVADGGLVAVVMSSLDQQSAAVRRPGLGDRPL